MKKVIGLCLMMISTVVMMAQEEYHIKNFGENDELKVRGATCVTQVNGFIWIGTSKGFCAFDGNHVYPYTIPDPNGMGGYYSRVTSLAPFSDEELWIGTKRGIYVFNCRDEHLQKFTTKNLPESPNVRAMLFDQEGRLWTIMNNQAYLIDVKEKKAECIGEGVVSPVCMTVAKNGTVWLGDNEGTLYRYDSPNHRLRSYNVKPEGAKKFTNLVSITEMRNRQLALVSYNDGICMFSPEKFTSKLLLTHDDEGFPIVAHTSITPDGDDLWIGTERGVVIYHTRDRHLSGIRQSRMAANSMSDNAVHSLFVDRENGVWAGTYFGGMNRISISPRNFSVFLSEGQEADGDVVREICEDNYGHLWVGTEDGGLYLLNKEKNVLQLAHVDWEGAPPPFNIQSLMRVGDDELWVSSLTNGIYVVDTRSMRLKRRYEKTNRTMLGYPIGAISMCHQNGTVFASSSAGVYIWDEKEDVFNMMPNMSGVYAHHLYADRHGNVWVATFDKGLWKIRQKNGKWRAEQTKFDYKCATVVMEDSRGLYWVGTDVNGLMSYDDKTGKTEQLDVSERLCHETVTNIVEDHHHRLWISTFNGLYSYNIGKKVVNHVTTANGLPSTYLNYSSGYVDEDGIVYIGTYKGLVSFNPSSFVLSRERLKPYFLRLHMNGKHIVPNDETGILKQTLYQTKEITLTRDQNTFSIDYAVPTYRSGEVVWYRYRMNPDEPWVITENARPIQVTNLSTGTYKITLQASFNPERWEGEAAAITLKVAAPTWLSLGAFIGYAAVIVMIVVVVMLQFKKKETRKLTNQENSTKENHQE